VAHFESFHRFVSCDSLVCVTPCNTRSGSRSLRSDAEYVLVIDNGILEGREYAVLGLVAVSFNIGAITLLKVVCDRHAVLQCCRRRESMRTGATLLRMALECTADVSNRGHGP